ncbi:Gfo/Idh/MocA family protein [Tabrizicola sp.]|uniref:Gfo/Idh/MocA family protein n=1 Tax=Tabrizicola sp. TaxID=2005166 RepID=UPI003D2D13C5
MASVKWGILGASNFALNRMGPAIHAAHGAELVAVASSSADKVAGFQAYAPAARHIPSYDALLADPGVDVVYIPLPNHLHVDWTLKALAAGKHVLTEKPIAMRAQEIDALIAARDKTGLIAAEAYMIVHHPQWQRAKEWVEAGEIGTLRHVDAQFSFYQDDAANIRNRPETGGGSLRDIGVYTFGSARFVTGAEPVELSSRVVRENDVEIWAQVAATMEGPLGRYTYNSMTTMRAFNRQVVTLQGTKGMIRLEGGPFNAGVHDLAEIELHQGMNRMLVERFPTVNQYQVQVEAFCASVRTGAPFAWSLENAKGTQAMIDWAYRVAEEVRL